MIDARELRIGNWVNDQAPYEDHFQVKWTHIASTVENGAEYRPIPLTEEWLLKFGFKYKQHRKIWDNNQVIIWVINDEWEIASIKRKHPLKYVHQLQNLYFALCGEELTIKESV